MFPKGHALSSMRSHATHNLELARCLDRVVALEGGRLKIGCSATRRYALLACTATNAAPKVVSSPRNGSIGAINLAMRRERG